MFSPGRVREGAAVRDLTLLAGLLGLLLVVCIVLKMGAERAGLPALVGYILLGFVVRLLDHAWGLPAETAGILDFLGLFGVVFLLFGVGLKTDLGGLGAVLGSAGWIWVGNVLASGGVGYLAARYLLARYAEGRITSFLDWEGGPDRTVAVSGIGLGIAALAGMLGWGYPFNRSWGYGSPAQASPGKHDIACVRTGVVVRFGNRSSWLAESPSGVLSKG